MKNTIAINLETCVLLENPTEETDLLLEGYWWREGMKGVLGLMNRAARFFKGVIAILLGLSRILLPNLMWRLALVMDYLIFGLDGKCSTMEPGTDA